MRKKKEYVRMCPKCGSVDIGIDFSNMLVWKYGAPSKYRCRECNHTSNIFPEVPKKDIKKYERGIKEKRTKWDIESKEELVDTSTGFGIGIWEVGINMITVIIIGLTWLFYDEHLMLFLFSIMWTISIGYLVIKTIKNQKKY